MKAKTVTTRCWAEASPSAPAPAVAPTAKPRRLSPFGSISLRETALAGHRPHLLGLPRKIARGISLRETTLCGCPLRGHGFATPHRYFAVPVTAAPRRGPNGKTPALAPVRSHFAARNRAGRSSAPPGPMFCRSRHGCAAPGPQRQNPGACSRSVTFRCAKPRWPVIGPTGADVLPFPSRLRRAGAPTAKPRRPLPAFLTLRK